MGQAKRRGTFEQRKEAALAEVFGKKSVFERMKEKRRARKRRANMRELAGSGRKLKYDSNPLPEKAKPAKKGFLSIRKKDD